jgi:hypothetical protein
LKLFCKIALCLSTSKPKIEQAYFHPVGKLRFKNHPKVHLIDAPIVEISSTFIRKSIKEGKTFSLFYRLKFGNILIIIILQNILNTIFTSFYLLKSAGKIVILPDNKKTSVCGICLLSQTIFSFLS